MATPRVPLLLLGAIPGPSLGPLLGLLLILMLGCSVGMQEIKSCVMHKIAQHRHSMIELIADLLVPGTKRFCGFPRHRVDTGNPEGFTQNFGRNRF